jgi:hypothetical protein
MPEITVTANGTEKLLSKLDPSKATGPPHLMKFLHAFSNNMYMNSISYVQEVYNIYMLLLMLLACN